MNNLLNALKLLKYNKNNFNTRLHEKNLENLIKKYGYKYKLHPNGKQNPPDIRVYYGNDDFVDIECKSCQKYYKPMWNSTYPKSDNIIYIYNNKSDLETIIFNGEEIVTDKVKNILEEYKLLNKELQNNINAKLQELNDLENPYKMRVYARNMFVQTSNLDASKSEEYFNNVLNKYT